MTKPKHMPRRSERLHEQRTKLIKDMIAEETAASNQKTEKLKALRLANAEGQKAKSK